MYMIIHTPKRGGIILAVLCIKKSLYENSWFVIFFYEKKGYYVARYCKENIHTNKSTLKMQGVVSNYTQNCKSPKRINRINSSKKRLSLHFI